MSKCPLFPLLGMSLVVVGQGTNCIIWGKFGFRAPIMMTTRFVIITVSASVTWFVVWASTWVNIGRAGKERRFEWLCILYCHTGVAYVCSLYLVPCTLYQSLLPGTWHGLISGEWAKGGDFRFELTVCLPGTLYHYLVQGTLYQYLVSSTNTWYFVSISGTLYQYLVLCITTWYFVPIPGINFKEGTKRGECTAPKLW